MLLNSYCYGWVIQATFNLKIARLLAEGEWLGIGFQSMTAQGKYEWPYSTKYCDLLLRDEHYFLDV